jgi:hypothetical protein
MKGRLRKVTRKDMATRAFPATVLLHTILPMLATPSAPFDKPGWLFEVRGMKFER